MNTPEYLPTNLTEPQRQAILHQGSPLLILAGPGSGKTEVITWRVAHLIRSGQASPDEFLITTFTNKAAEELKDRLKEKLPEANVELMQISTIHAFCADLLRQFASLTPFPGGFHILDEDGQFLFVYSRRNLLGLSKIVKSREEEFYASVIRTFNLITEELVDTAQLLEYYKEQLTTDDEKFAEFWEENIQIANAFNLYRQLLQQEGFIDFAHLQYFTYLLLKEHRDVLETIRQRFRFILVDEYQDTNALQNKILSLIMPNGENLTVVGDDDQSIYRFRGATVKNLLNFENTFPNTHKVILQHNFRSFSSIVDGSLQVIRNNSTHIEKPLKPMRGEGNEVLLVYERTAREEAFKVVEILQQLHQSGKIKRYGDVAILLRSVRSYSEPYKEALQFKKIPYHIIGDASFFDRDEIVQLLHVFNFLSTNKEWGDRFLREPLVGLSEETREVLKQFKGNLMAFSTPEQLLELGINDETDRQKLVALIKLKHKVQTQRYNSILEIFYEVLAATQCIQRFEQQKDIETMANIGQLSQLIARWDEFSPSKNIFPFLEYMKLLRKSGREPVRIPPEDAVQIMTIHQAKGLEFPVVVLGAAMEGRLPTRPRKERYVIPYQFRASGMPELEDKSDALHRMDERKLFYVATTRARDLLIVATADVVNKRGGGPSEFVKEMFGDNLKEAARWTQDNIIPVKSAQGKHFQSYSRYSFSQILYYVQCPMRYKFAVILGLETSWKDPVNFGANVHRALEKIHTLRMKGETIDDNTLPRIIDAVWVPSKRVEDSLNQKYKAAALNQIKRYVKNYLPAPEEITHAEFRFTFGLDQYVLTGQVDLIKSYQDGSLEIVDFKTLNRVDIEAQGFAMQMDIYALGIEATLGKTVARQTIHFLGDNQVVSLEWNNQRKNRAIREITALLNQIEANHFPPNPEYCKSCTEFQKICQFNT